MLKKLLSLFSNNKGQVSLDGRKALVVDDGEVERRMMEKALSKANMQVITASSGEEGVSLAQGEKPDVIVLDFMMPGINGKEACERLKADETTKDIPVIFLTGSASPTNLIECFEAGAAYFLQKPISAGALVKQVRETLNDQEDAA